jgi:hypothetical protein
MEKLAVVVSQVDEIEYRTEPMVVAQKRWNSMAEEA